MFTVFRIKTNDLAEIQTIRQGQFNKVPILNPFNVRFAK